LGTPSRSADCTLDAESASSATFATRIVETRAVAFAWTIANRIVAGTRVGGISILAAGVGITYVGFRKTFILIVSAVDSCPTCFAFAKVGVRPEVRAVAMVRITRVRVTVVNINAC